MSTEAPLFTLPRPLGPYQLVAHLGRGGMGDVFLAKPRPPYPSPSLRLLAEQERFVVVKTVRADHAREPGVIARFIDEARTATLVRHKNICRVLDAGIYEGHAAIVMEYVAGFSLSEVFRRLAQRDERMARRVALYVAGELLEALDYAHTLRHPATGEALGLVHRDVSPHNVLVGDNGEVKLIDFGIASSKLQRRETEPGVAIGKVLYMSPEQAAGLPVDARSDVFSASVVVAELLGGYRFYEGLSVDEVGRWLARGALPDGALPAGLQMLDDSDRAPLEAALAWRVDKRTTSTALLRKRLFDGSREKPATAAHLRTFLASIFPGEAERRRVKFDALCPAPEHSTHSMPTHIVENMTRATTRETPETRDTQRTRPSQQPSVSVIDCIADDSRVDEVSELSLSSSRGGVTRLADIDPTRVADVAPTELADVAPTELADALPSALLVAVDVCVDDGSQTQRSGSTTRRAAPPDAAADDASPGAVDAAAATHARAARPALPTFLDMKRWPTWPTHVVVDGESSSPVNAGPEIVERTTPSVSLTSPTASNASSASDSVERVFTSSQLSRRRASRASRVSSQWRARALAFFGVGVALLAFAAATASAALPQ